MVAGRVLSVAVVALLMLGVLAPALVVAQEEVPEVVKLKIDKTEVYPGFQWIEIEAYLYVPSGYSIEKVEGRAVLKSGLETSLDLALTRLRPPTEITVGNKTYKVGYLLLGRLIVPQGMLPGKASLKIEVKGTFKKGEGEPYKLSYTKEVAVTIVDSRPVIDKRMEAYIKLERARTAVELAGAAGADVTGLSDRIAELEEALATADSNLYVKGLVEDALKTYDTVIEEAESVAVHAALALIAAAKERDSRLDAINASVSALEARIKALEDAVSKTAKAVEEVSGNVAELAKSIEKTNKNVASVAKVLSEYSKTVNDYTAKINKAIEELDKKISKVADDTSKALESMGSQLEKVAKEAASGVAGPLGAIQGALVALAVIMLLGFAVLGIGLRRVVS